MIEALDGTVLLGIVLVVASDKWEAYLRLAEYKGNAIYLGKDDKKDERKKESQNPPGAKLVISVSPYSSPEYRFLFLKNKGSIWVDTKKIREIFF